MTTFRNTPDVITSEDIQLCNSENPDTDIDIDSLDGSVGSYDKETFENGYHNSKGIQQSTEGALNRECPVTQTIAFDDTYVNDTFNSSKNENLTHLQIERHPQSLESGFSDRCESDHSLSKDITNISSGSMSDYSNCNGNREVKHHKEATNSNNVRPSKLPVMKNSIRRCSDHMLTTTEVKSIKEKRFHKNKTIDLLSQRSTSVDKSNTSLSNQFIAEGCHNQEMKVSKRKVSRAYSVGSSQGPDTPSVKENTSSRLRFEQRHIVQMHESEEIENGDYMTPTQRKGQIIKEQKTEIKELQTVIEKRDKDIIKLKLQLEEEATRIKQDKDNANEQCKEDLATLTTEHDSLKQSYQNALLTIVHLEENVLELKEQIAQQDKKNETIYLEMYRKGQEAALFERNVELERLAVNAEGSVTMDELTRKLVSTEAELAKWQSLRRQESYDAAEKPETEADATLHFLRDSFYHYLTAGKDSDRHLRAITRMLGYSGDQMKKIATCVTEMKNKSA